MPLDADYRAAMRALVRGISPSFADALSANPSSIDVERARVQHAAYVAALRQAGVTVTELPPLDAHPDGCFVEDCAVIAGGRALLTRPGAPSRQGEVDTVAEALAAWLPLERTTAPATLDGGDVLRVGKTFYVGRTARTNAAGAARLAEVFADHRVVEVPVGDVLHLKCVCTPMDDRRMVLAEGTIDPGIFRGVEVVLVPHEESYAANVLVVNGHALIASGFPATARALAAAGLHVVPLETTEIRKADGSLTCMSLLM